MSCSQNRFHIKFFALLFVYCTTQGYSQDSVFLKNQPVIKFIPPSKHSPSKAALLSAILPGAGQIYNQKYWKPPIVWAGLIGFTYMYLQENTKYQTAKTAYLQLLDTSIKIKEPYNGTTNVDIVQSTKNLYKSQRDMFMIFGILFYGLNIIDAVVDAHLFKFDVGDDLSMKMMLDMRNYPQAPQIPSLSINFNLKTKNRSFPR